MESDTPDPHDSAQPDDRPSASLRTLDYGDIVEKAYWGAVGLAAVVGLLALNRFYIHASAAIERLVQPEYVNLYLAGFNLVLVLLAALVASLLIRRLSRRRSDS